jgi:hypothetical protein
MLKQEAEFIALVGLDQWQRLDERLQAIASRQARQEQARASAWMKRGAVQKYSPQRIPPGYEPPKELSEGIADIVARYRVGAKRLAMTLELNSTPRKDVADVSPAVTS